MLIILTKGLFWIFYLFCQMIFVIFAVLIFKSIELSFQVLF